jgi:ubiquinone/menaquinone biosynthesis C-methylase UbiE
MSKSEASEIAANYDEWAETYDTVQNRTRDLAGEALREVNPSIAGRVVVEIGCGTGRNTHWLAQQSEGPAEIIALDFSEGMLERARTRVHDPRVRFLQHDIRAGWPLSDDSADLVIVMLVLEHVRHLQPVFSEAARVLRAGGELFVCELHPARQMLGKQAQFTSAATGELKLVEAFLHRTEDYRMALAAVGFEVIRQDDWWDEDNNETPRLLSIHVRLGHSE